MGTLTAPTSISATIIILNDVNIDETGLDVWPTLLDEFKPIGGSLHHCGIIRAPLVL